MEALLYKKMLELKEKTEAYDVIYLGTITLVTIDTATNKKIQITKDIMIPTKYGPDGHILKFYDENQELIAVDNGEGIYPSSDYADVFNMDENKIVLESLSRLSINKGMSLNQTTEELKRISKQLGIPEEHITSVSKAVFSSKEIDDEDEKIHLEEKKNINKDKKSSVSKKDPLSSIKTKQKANLSYKPDGYHSLGQILGVPSNGSLVVVYSSDIANNKNHTKFSFLIQENDGTLKQPSNLLQIAGIHSSLDIEESNSDGSKIENKAVNSSYKINGTGGLEYVLTANIGSHGTIDLGFGTLPKTQGNNSQDSTIITTPIETSSTYYHTTKEVKEALVSSSTGTDRPTDRVRETKNHQEAGCEQLTLAEVDGDPETGHQHLDENGLYTIATEIYNSNDSISYAFSINDIKELLNTAYNNHPEFTLEQLQAYVSKDCEQYVDSIHRQR